MERNQRQEGDLVLQRGTGATISPQFTQVEGQYFNQQVQQQDIVIPQQQGLTLPEMSVVGIPLPTPSNPLFQFEAAELPSGVSLSLGNNVEARLPLAPKGYSVRSVAGKGDFGSLPPLVTRPVLKGTYPQHRDSLRGLGCVANSVGLPCNTCTDRLVNAGVQMYVGYDKNKKLVNLSGGNSCVQKSGSVSYDCFGTDVTERVQSVLQCGIGEAVQSSNSESQRINDALADYEMQDDLLQFSSAASESLNSSERAELEQLRQLVYGAPQPAPRVLMPFEGEQRVIGGRLCRFGSDRMWHIVDWQPVQPVLQQPVVQPAVQPVQHVQPVQPLNDVGDLSQQLASLALGSTPVQPNFAPQHAMEFPHVPAPIQGGQSRGVAESTTVRPPSLVPREIKVERPLTFSGKHSELQNFIFVMKQYIDTVALGTGSRACRLLVSYLRDDALTWWRSYSDNSTDIFDSLELDELIDALTEQFTDIDRELKLRDRILALRQITSVQAYVTQFKKLQLELGDGKLGPEMALHCFVQGLKPFTRQQVHLQRPNTFQDAVILAERCDQSLYWLKGGSVQRSGPPRGGQQRVSFKNASQFSNVRTSGPSPMVLGAMQGGQRSDVICYYCGKKGHVKKNCFKWQNDQKRAGTSAKPGKPSKN